MKIKIVSLIQPLVILSILLSTINTAASNKSAQQSAAVCAGCHGLDGIGIGDEFPNLAGQKENYLIKQLKAFRSGDRKDPTMNAMIKSFDDQTIASLAKYYSSQQKKIKESHSSQITLTDKPSRNEFPEDVYFTLKKAASITKLPSEVVWTGKPNMLFSALTPDGKILLSTSPSNNTVTLFNSTTGDQLATIKVGKAPKGVKVSPDGNLAYISNQNSDDISVLDIKAQQIIDTIKVPSGPHNVRFTNDGKLAYATLQGGAGIAVIDTDSRKLDHVIATPGLTGPHNLDLSFDEKTLYVRDFVHHVAVIDLATEKVVKVIKVGNGHGGIDVFPNDQFVATAAIGDNYISIINTQDLTVNNIKVGNGSHGIRASLNSQWLYVTLTKENQIIVIDTSTMKIVKRFSTGEFPFWVAVNGNP